MGSSVVSAVTTLLFLSQAVAGSYAPTPISCPSSSLVRPADSLNSNEASYVSQRKQKADKALSSWLSKTNPGFVVNGTLPTLGLAVSGGGYRSLLVGAGVIQGFDERDSNISTSGLYQALTYQSGLSGGAWLLSSIIGNNYPTITSLKQDLWEQAFQDSLLVPENLLVAVAYADIASDIEAKAAAGFPPTLTDPWGRLLSYQLFYGTDGGVDITLSSVSGLSNFTDFEAPFPIILALGVKTWEGDCTPGPNATIYEFTPYEFGSWDSDVSAFTPTEYLGTSLSGGQPSNGSCITNYDNIGYVLGTSSNLFNNVCIPVTVGNSTGDNYTSLAQDLSVIVNKTHEFVTRDEYAVYPNPFYGYNSPSGIANSADAVWTQQELYLADGGEANQNDPIWPFLQSYRDVDVLIVNDNSADTSANYPNGSEILTTYVQSTNRNLTKMPYIPSVDIFLAEGLNTRPTFFGCTESDKLTIIYIPNVNMTYNSGQSTYKLWYTTDETDAMIGNGVAMAEQADDDNWATCLGCAILAKTSFTLPVDCTLCFAQYCYEDLNSTLSSVSSALVETPFGFFLSLSSCCEQDGNLNSRQRQVLSTIIMSTTLKTRFGDIAIQKDIVQGDFDNIPIIDLAPMSSPNIEERKELAKQIYDACSRVGFFYIKNHGVQEELIRKVHEAAHDYFALPEDKKMESYIGNSQKFRGFSPLYGEHSDEELSDKPAGNLSEAFDIGYEIAGDSQKGPDDVLPPDHYSLYGGNQWPKEEHLPGFKKTYLAYFQEILELSRRMMKIFALALQLPEDYFDGIVKHPGCISRLMHYPPQPVPGEEVAGINTHTDYECFTILSQDKVPALQVLNVKGQWVAAPPIPGTFVINIGDFFAFWTNGIFRSTLHRATNLTGEERFSVPFFFGVDYDATISVLESCITAENPAKSGPVKAGEHVRKQLSNTYIKFGEKATVEAAA
ncbi:hypothetical protein DTO169C6_7814 [Paecilomyces variotii]|nr:hypothetical protein DTO169C6_7814 [Paecilomyces variotii]